MPTTRDPQRTQRQILDAAAAEFCEAGPAGARIDSIAAAAGVNKRMLYHYFGSKDGLFAAVLLDRLESVLDAMPGADLAERLRALQRHAVAHPENLRLLMWEALAYRDEAGPVAASLANAWRDGMADRAAPPGDADAAQVPLALAGLVLFPFAFPQLTRLISGYTIGDPEFVGARDRFLATVAALFEAKAPAPSAPKPRYRLTANVTESSADQRRLTDSKTLK
ncbi:MAG TPA: TetR/AcrR family transcriptional regulator [Pseudomonadales bacterium]